MFTDILTVAWKEIKELPYLRKDKTRTNLFSLLIFLAVFGILLPWQTGREWVTSPFSLLPWAWLPFMMVGTTMVDSFAGERERHTLETLLASRLSDRAILLGKILAGIVYGLAITFLCVLVSLATVNLVHGGAGLLLYPATIALGLLVIVLLVSTLASGLGVLVSLRAASVRQAQQTFTIAYFVLFIPILVFPMLPSSATQKILDFLTGTDFTSMAIEAGVAVALLDVILILAAMARFKRSRLILD
jgi:ABC-2 type transport system permease protein